MIEMSKNILEKVIMIGVPIALTAALATPVVMDSTEASRREVTIAGIEERIEERVGVLWGQAFTYPVKVYQYQTEEGVVFEVGGERYKLGDRVLATYYKSGRVRAEKIAGVKK